MIPFIIYEAQTSDDYTVAFIPPVSTADENEAWSVYYSKLASAAISTVYLHTVFLCTADGRLIQSRSFMHGQVPPPEPTPIEPDE